ncbi:hypothetical protein [Lacticaseibacillus paracasei]|uniref:hypothetical protein n=1 Tax=Lacticaseibacillus paracasei TaxID=1597 RepID=UPI002A598B61|nr:hypothetical protein [Lacticaseibacillus paracasei]MDY0839803.1 hypothetical protein [Lacticaseibacillus paracasei]
MQSREQPLFTLPFTDVMVRIQVLRLVSFLPILIMVLIGWFYLPKRFSPKVATIFMYSVVTMPLLIEAGGEIRMYSWAALFVLGFFLALPSLTSSRWSSVVVAAAFGLAAAYTHYFGLMVVALLYFFTLINQLYHRQAVAHLFVAIGLDILGYLPWLFVLYHQITQVSSGYWIPKLTFTTIVQLCLSAFAGATRLNTIVAFLFVVAIAVTLGITLMKPQEHVSMAVMDVLAYAALIIVSVVLSLLVGHTIVTPRYLVVVLPTLWLGVALLIQAQTRPVIAYGLMGLMVIIGGMAYVNNASQVRQWTTRFEPTQQQLQKLQPDAVVYYDQMPILSSSATYVKTNELLPGCDQYQTMPLFKRVFAHVTQAKSQNLTTKSTPVYFVKAAHPGNAAQKKAASRFYRAHHWQRVSQLDYPRDSGAATLYRLVD